MDRWIIVTVIFFYSGTAGAEALPPNCPSRPSDPEDAKTSAGTWFSKGIELATEEKYDLAEQAFRCSFQLTEHPATLLNIAKAAKHGGTLTTAINTYKEFLEKYPDDTKVPFVMEEIGKIEAELEARSDTAGDGVDAAPEEPVDNLVEADDASDKQKEAELEITRSSKMKDQDPKMKDPQTAAAGAAAASSSVNLDESRLNRVHRLKIIGWTTFSIGGGALIAAIATGSIALSYNNYLEKNCDEKECIEPYHKKVDRMENLAVTTNVLIGVGAAVTTVGAALLVVSKRKQKETPSLVSVSPQVAPGYAGLGIQGAF